MRAVTALAHTRSQGRWQARVPTHASERRGPFPCRGRATVADLPCRRRLASSSSCGPRSHDKRAPSREAPPLKPAGLMARRRRRIPMKAAVGAKPAWNHEPGRASLRWHRRNGLGCRMFSQTARQGQSRRHDVPVATTVSHWGNRRPCVAQGSGRARRPQCRQVVGDAGPSTTLGGGMRGPGKSARWTC